MVFHLELGSGGDGVKYESFKGKAIVVDSKGRHYSQEPIPMDRAKAQMRVLQQKLSHRSKPEPSKTEHMSGKTDDPPTDPKPQKFIQEVVAGMKKGAFTAQAKQHGMTVPEFREEVLEHPDKYTITTRRRAQFLENIRRK